MLGDQAGVDAARADGRIEIEGDAGPVERLFAAMTEFRVFPIIEP